MPESLPPSRRHRGGLTQLRVSARAVVGWQFVGYLIVTAFSMEVTFVYVATSAFILQSMNGLSPLLYSADLPPPPER